MLAAIAIAMQLPVDATNVERVAKEYSVDSRDVMAAVCEMLDVQSVAESDMELNNQDPCKGQD